MINKMKYDLKEINGVELIDSKKILSVFKKL
jgi:hypothetical protein